MREVLKNAIHNAILFECKLLHQERNLDKSCLSSQNDICFSNSNSQEISKIIYNGIVEFAANEYEIDYTSLENCIYVQDSIYCNGQISIPSDEIKIRGWRSKKDDVVEFLMTE